MEFLDKNVLNTTTMVTVNSGTDSVSYLFDKKNTQRYQSSGLNDDTTAATLTVTFAATIPVDRIILENINFKSFKIYHSSNAANTITLVGSPTSTSEWATNSTTTMLLHFATVNASSITIVATTTIDANSEKRLGELWISEKKFALEYNPDVGGYSPKLDRKEYTHEAAGGGWVNYVIDKFFTAGIKLTYQSKSMTTKLFDLYDTKDSFIFIPFPTGTGWEEGIYEVNWVGDWNFKYAGNNYATLGYSGDINLKETPR